MAGTLAVLSHLVERDGAAALVSILEARGSTPREAGTRMVVSGSGEISGTVGGGRLELEAIERASALISTGRDTAERFALALGPTLGQCCGGQVTLIIEVFTSARAGSLAGLVAAEAAGTPFLTAARFIEGEAIDRHIVSDAAATEPASDLALAADGTLCERFGRSWRSVYLFGAGHVGRALVLALAPLPFSVTWIDSRAEIFANLPFANLERRVSARPSDELARAPDGTFVVIMTHDHAIDFDILDAALSSGRFGFVGVIGSRTKRARFESRLRSMGYPERTATSFVSPLGIAGISAKEPPVIATAIAAQLLIEDQRFHGRATAPPAAAVVGSDQD